MPRGNRYFLPGYVWHITHRCHKKEFLLKFSRDRRRWLHWLYEARKRYGLSVLNYIVTSNHIHLLVKDTGSDTIPRSMQLIAGRTGQEYNQRKSRKGAYWEDRYHATAIQADDHLFKCLVYIDMNMVRAGVVSHPTEWHESGYREIQSPPERYRIIDFPELMKLSNIRNLAVFQQQHSDWVEQALKQDMPLSRNRDWSSSIAVGSHAFVEEVQRLLGVPANHRKVIQQREQYVLRESAMAYDTVSNPQNDALRLENSYLWDVL
jgi:putative transposase